MDLPGLHHQGLGMAHPLHEGDGLAKRLGNDPHGRSDPSRGLRSDADSRSDPSRGLRSDADSRSGSSRGLRSDADSCSGPFRGLGSDPDGRRRRSREKSLITLGLALGL